MSKSPIQHHHGLSPREREKGVEATVVVAGDDPQPERIGDGSLVVVCDGAAVPKASEPVLRLARVEGQIDTILRSLLELVRHGAHQEGRSLLAGYVRPRHEGAASCT